MPSLIGILVLLAPLLALFTMTSKAVLSAAATIFCWGLLAFALISPLQMRVVNDKIGRHGDGSVHLPLDYRGP